MIDARFPRRAVAVLTALDTVELAPEAGGDAADVDGCPCGRHPTEAAEHEDANLEDTVTGARIPPDSCAGVWGQWCSGADPGCGYCWFLNTSIMTATLHPRRTTWPLRAAVVVYSLRCAHLPPRSS